VGGNDHLPGTDAHYGLVSGFTDNRPVWRPAWNAVSLYYNLRDPSCAGAG
jgi:hypothetical protein